MDKKFERISEEIRERIRKNYKFCCYDMEWSVLDEPEECFNLNATIRAYDISLPDKTCVGINFCPWCGEKLPTNLYNEWKRILTHEYGIKTPSAHMDDDDFPPEFKTEEWWKKRGL